jgi:histidyl-tRNA synthetase
MSHSTARRPASETPIPLVKGTADWLPTDHTRLAGLEALVLERFALAGYERLNTPVLEPVELHERKSGAGIVGKLFDLSGHSSSRVCLRPELTAGIVRAYTTAEPPPALPWRVSHAGAAFRRETSTRPGRLREFRQVGVERLGDSGIFADAEVISLASSSLEASGVKGATIRLGHVGLTLEMLERSGLPPAAQAALVEMLSEAAAEGGDVGSLGRGLDHFAEWLRQASGLEEIPLPVETGDDGGIDRLFRTLVPVINGRRAGHEIIHRLRRKWDLGHGWLDALDRVRDQVRALGDLKGPPGEVLDRLARDFEKLAPDSVASLRALIQALGDHGVDLDRLELDLGFGRGIGFYSQMIFEIIAPTPDGPVEVCGGGRYDGLARVLGSDRDDRGVGFAFGLERLDSALSAQGHRPTAVQKPTFLVVPSSSELVKEAVDVAALIRARGTRAIVEAAWQGRAIAERARSLGASRSVVVGDSKAEAPLILIDHARQTTRPTTFEELQRIAAALDEEPKP